jgi:hypothetical protein
MSTNKIKKFVYAEPEFWRLLGRLSKMYGTRKPEAGSMSEAFRRFAKAGMLQKNQQLKNIDGIDWKEAY